MAEEAGERGARGGAVWAGGYAALSVLVGVLLLALELPDHGRTMDDGVQRRRGEATLAYVATLDPAHLPPDDLGDFSRGDRLYGPFGVATSVALGRVLAPLVGDPETERHLELHAGLVAWFAVLLGATLALGRRFSGSGVGGLVAGALLLAQPRVLGLATVSPSDLPAAALLALVVLLVQRWLDRPVWARALPLAAAIGGLLAVRAQNGVVLLPVLAALLAPRLLRRGVRLGGARHGEAGEERGLPAAQLLAAPFLCYAFWVLCWPDFWRAPLTAPWEVLGTLATLKDERYAIPIFWFGESVLGPPEYPYVMLAVTTPLLVLAAAALGLGLSVRRLRRGDGLAIGLAVWFLLSTGKHLSGYGNHGGIRHFLDAYVPLTLWAAAGLCWVGGRVAARRGELLALAGAAALVPLARSLHPFESSYYNALVGGVAGAEGRLNLDPDGTAMLPLMKELRPLLAPGDVILFLGNADLVTQVALPPGTIVLSVLPANAALLARPGARSRMAERRVWLVQPNHPTLFAASFARGTLEEVVAVGPAGRTVARAARVADPAFYEELIAAVAPNADRGPPAEPPEGSR